MSVRAPQQRAWNAAPGTRGHWPLAAALLVLAVVAVAPARIVDPDALSHLANGRWIVEHGEVPRNDPFTFIHPSNRCANPEWLGDLIWFGLYRTGGEPTTQVFKLLVVVCALLLALRAAWYAGASPVVAVGLMLVLLPASAARFTVRNHIHALWLMPVFQLIGRRVLARRLWWLLLLPLCWLWGNLHASFVLGWPVLIAAALDHRSDGRLVDWKTTGLVLIVHGLLPMAGPLGTSAYAQIWDHLVGAQVYRRFITEWQSPLCSPAILAMVPLHVVAAVGAYGLLSWSCVRDRPGTALLFVLVCVLAYASRRFIPLVLVLGVPHVARTLAGLARRRMPALQPPAPALALALPLIYIALASWSLARVGPSPLFHREGTARESSRFLATHGPAGSRVFNSFNAGPWLLWNTPEIKHHIDPRNNRGSDALEAYVRMLGKPRRLVGRMNQMDVDFVLLSLADSRANGLVELLDDSARWHLVFLDGYYALYGRARGPAAGLVRRIRYRVIKARRAVDLKLAVQDCGLRTLLLHDIRQLRGQGKLLATGYDACLEVLTDSASGGAPSPRTAAQLRVLRGVAARLPPTRTLAACIGIAVREIDD
jgi:hypothetical protein